MTGGEPTATRPRPTVGVNTFVWTSPLTEDNLPDLVRHIADLGFDAVELPLEHIGDWDPHRAGDLLAARGLGSVVCAVFMPGRDLTAAPDERIEETARYVRQCIDAAKIQGSSYVVGPMYTAVGRTWRMGPGGRQAAIRRLRESLAPLADYAAASGLSLALEPLNRYETSLINTVEQALEVIDGLPPEGIGLNLDTYHQNVEEKSISGAIRAAGPRLQHLQVCANDRGSPGDDHLDWSGIRRALADIDYGGICGIESFTADNDTIAVAASIWRPLAESPDRLAQDGLTFLRRWADGWPG